MVVTCYIKLFQAGADRHNGILMSLLLLVAETKNFFNIFLKNKIIREIIDCCSKKFVSKGSFILRRQQLLY